MTTYIHNQISDADDKWVIWTEEAGLEDAMAPWNDPVKYMDRVRFCDKFQYLNDFSTITGISVTHQSVAGVTGSGYAPPGGGGGTGTGAIADGQVLIQDQTLYTHSLGYVPQFQVRVGDEIVSPGTVVQYVKADHLIRTVSVYATTSIIGIRNIGISSKVTLPSVSVSYDITLFRQSDVIPGAPLCQLDQNSGNDLIMGHGRITSALRPLRRTRVGDTSVFWLPVTRTMDTRDGAIRKINKGGYTDYQGTSGYSGSLIAAGFIDVTTD